MVKAVIFDLDGTLANTLADLGKAMNKMLEHFSFPQRNRDEILSAICYGQREFVVRSLPEHLRQDSLQIDICQNYYASCYDECYNDSTQPYEGILSCLEALKRAGLKIAVVTNKAQNHAENVCEKCFGRGCFDVLIGGGSGYPAKPSPEAALKAAELMGVKSSECIFVGDSDVDIKTGKNASMLTIGVSWGYRSENVLEAAKADMIVSTALQLKEIILKLA